MSSQKELLAKYRDAASSPQGVLIALVGPTASGKTSAALGIADDYPIEIICADSRTIYQGMDIGTAKPTWLERVTVPHWGLDIVTPREKYSVAEFVAYAEQKLSEIWSRNCAAVLVGGSGMYIDALLFGYSFRTLSAQNLNYAAMPQEDILSLAKRRYPNDIKNIDVKNTRRLVQLLEKGPVNNTDREMLKYNVKIIGINPQKGNLQMRIEKRTDKMLKQGFVQECKTLVDTYGDSCSALQTTGYSAVASYLKGEVSYEDMQQRIVIDTRRLAKKQLTWFRRNPYIEWVESGDEAVATGISYLNAQQGTI